MENKQKCFGLAGFLTVEASLLIPFILWLYLLLIFTSFFLYNQCRLTQDAYLLSFRGSVFTGWAEGYGEVIYGRLATREEPAVEAYLAARSTYISEAGRLPAFKKTEEQIMVAQTKPTVFQPTIPEPLKPNQRISRNEIKVTVTLQGKITAIPGGKSEITATGQATAVSPIAVIRTARKEN